MSGISTGGIILQNFQNFLLDLASYISGLALTVGCFKEAVNMLEARFGNKQFLIMKHIDKLLSQYVLLQTVQKVNEYKKLREAYDTIETHVRSLKSLDIDSIDIDTKQYRPVLLSIVMSKLPNEIRLISSRSMSESCLNY